MLSLSVLLLLLPSTHSGPTYNHLDSATGQQLTCRRCPPGTHLRAHCSATRATQCAPCPANHFTQHWNYLTRCLYCSTFCGDDQEVRTQCTPVNNRVCQCRDGFYMRYDVCVPHAQCPLGQGVRETGTRNSNTVCEKCTPGTFSANVSSVDRCEVQTDCKALGLPKVLRGTVWHDNICMSCQDLETEGSLQTLRKLIPDFFAFHKIQLSKLTRFARKLRQREDLPSHPTRNELLSLINKWISKAEYASLRQLPMMLGVSKLTMVPHKLERILEKFENPHFCSWYRQKNNNICSL